MWHTARMTLNMYLDLTVQFHNTNSKFTKYIKSIITDMGRRQAMPVLGYSNPYAAVMAQIVY